MASNSTVGSKPGPYSLAALIRGDQNSYEARVSDLIAKRSDGLGASGLGDRFHLPTTSFLRDLGISTPTAGGNLLSDGLEAVAAAARPPLLLERLGAIRVEVERTGPVSLPVWDDDFVGGWIAEGGAAPALNAPVRSITCTGKMAAARLGISRKLQLMGPGVEAAMLAEVQRAVAHTIEPAFFNGTGSSHQPLGICNTPGIGTKTFNAPTPTFQELVAMVKAYAEADGDLSSATWVMHPAMAASLLETQVTISDAQMLAVIGGPARQPLVLGIPAYVSQHVPSGRVLLLNPTELRLIYWGAPQLLIDRFSAGKSISGAMELHLFNLTDIAVLFPAHVILGKN